MKIYIKAQARQMRELEWMISSHADVIVEHILKLIIMPEHSAANHWKQEIATQLNRVKKLKSTGKYPTSDQIYSWTYDKVSDDIMDARWLEDLIDVIESDYNTYVSIDINTVMKSLDSICKDYFSWLAKNLSEKGMISNAMSYETLNSLILDWS